MNIPALIALLEALSPERRDFLARQLGVEPEWVEECSSADPTGGKYTAWIARLWKAGNIRLPEDADKVRTRLEQFHGLSRTSTWTAPRDILKYRTYADLVHALDAAAPGKKQAVRIAREEGLELLLSSNTRRIYRVTTEQAAAKYFRHTEWCVKDPVYYHEYGPPFFFMTAVAEDGSEAPHQLLHFDEYQCRDVDDEAASPAEFLAMGFPVEDYLTTPADIVAYAQAVGRVPEKEHLLLTDLNAALRYVSLVNDVIPWEDLEKAILASGLNRSNYISRYGQWATRGDRRVLWEAGEKALLGDLAAAAGHAAEVASGRLELGTESGTIGSTALSAVQWAADVRNTRWPEFEALLIRILDAVDTRASFASKITKSADGSLFYASLSQDSSIHSAIYKAAEYTKKHLPRGWPELEKFLLRLVTDNKPVDRADGTTAFAAAYYKANPHLVFTFPWEAILDALVKNTARAITDVDGGVLSSIGAAERRIGYFLRASGIKHEDERGDEDALLRDALGSEWAHLYD